MSVVDNPFHVLALPVDCGAMEVERAGQKWLGQLEVGVTSARTWMSPAGPRPRTPDLVRQAMADLRDPAKRLIAEVLYVPVADPPDWPELEPDPAAFHELGWR